MEKWYVLSVVLYFNFFYVATIFWVREQTYSSGRKDNFVLEYT